METGIQSTLLNAEIAAAPKRVQRVGSNASLRSRASSSSGRTIGLDALLDNNKSWALSVLEEDPGYFNRLEELQTPEYLWIGCSDSRVPANTIIGLQPGEVFVQRNVGNQATHNDMNCMSCLEYAVKELKVKTVIVCGHYNCGAVKAALRLPSKTPGLVNCWISDIRACRNDHQEELRDLGDSPNAQVDRLCELNVLRQTFHVCTSPVVQAAWDAGQQLEVYGCIYSLRDGRLKKLVGPLTGAAEVPNDEMTFTRRIFPVGAGGFASATAAAVASVAGNGTNGSSPSSISPQLVAKGSHVSANANVPGPGAAAVDGLLGVSEQGLAFRGAGDDEEHQAALNTATIVSMLAQHVSWAQTPPASSAAVTGAAAVAVVPAPAPAAVAVVGSKAGVNADAAATVTAHGCHDKSSSSASSVSGDDAATCTSHGSIHE